MFHLSILHTKHSTAFPFQVLFYSTVYLYILLYIIYTVCYIYFCTTTSVYKSSGNKVDPHGNAVVEGTFTQIL